MIFFAMKVFLLSSCLSFANPELSGTWNFFGFIYRGEEMAPINPKLNIEMKFESDKIVWLKYWREDEEGFCERKAEYSIAPSQNGDEQILYQKVLWLNPENRSDCGNDPDMRADVESWTPIEFYKSELRLILPLGEETIAFRFAPEQ